MLIKKAIGSIFKAIPKLGYFKKLKKSQNKVVVVKEIECGNDIVLSEIGQGNELRQKIDIKI